MTGAAVRLLRWGEAHPVRAVLGAYAGSRLVVLLALLVATRHQTPTGVASAHPGLLDLFGLWDGRWYADIARHGYPPDPPTDPVTGRLTYNSWAFYPLLPLLLAPFAAVGVPVPLAGVLLGLVLGALAAVLLLRLLVGRAPTPSRRRWALLAVALWCLQPATTVLAQPYTEALALVLLCATLLALDRHRYLLAGTLALALGLARAIAPVLLAVVLVHLALRWRADRRAGRTPLAGERLGSAFVVVASAVAGVLWPLVAGVVTGIPDAFLQSQAAWGQRPTDGLFVAWVRWAWEGHGLLGVLTLVLTVAAGLSLVLGRWGARLTPELRALGVVYPLYLLAATRPITSLWRFLLLDLPLAAVAASVLLGAGSPSPRARVVRVALVVVVLAAGVVVWTATLWTFEPAGSAPP